MPHAVRGAQRTMRYVQRAIAGFAMRGAGHIFCL
jgi:hypothetical protein